MTLFDEPNPRYGILGTHKVHVGYQVYVMTCVWFYKAAALVGANGAVIA